jgi:hypothetical protein
MSRTIETLNKFLHSKDKANSSVQEEIANIYLRTSTTKAKEKSISSRLKIPWVIASAALLIVLFLIISKSDIDIKVRILSDIPAIKAGASERAQTEKGIFFIKGGRPNKDIVKNISFLGDARGSLDATNNELALYNSKGYGWANYTLELKEPIDFNRFEIKYTARGERGDEYLVLVLADTNNRSYRKEKDLSSALSRDWQRYTINFRPVGNAIDLGNISTVRFEFGGLTAGNYPNAVIFLKDIYITKVKKEKWL